MSALKIGGNEELIYRAVLAKAGSRQGLDCTRCRSSSICRRCSPGQVDVWPGYVINEVIAAKEKGFDVNVI